MVLKPEHPNSVPPVLEEHKTASVAGRANLEVGKALHDTVLEVALVEVDIVVVKYTPDSTDSGQRRSETSMSERT